jgi:hypothetical protein
MAPNMIYSIRGHFLDVRPLRPSLARLKRWGTAGLDLLYPRVCHGCDLTLPFDAPREGLGAWFCGECEEALPRIEAPILHALCGGLRRRSQHHLSL